VFCMPEQRFKDDQEFIRLLADEVINVKDKYSLMDISMALNSFARLNPWTSSFLPRDLLGAPPKLRRVYIPQERKDNKEPDLIDIPFIHQPVACLLRLPSVSQKHLEPLHQLAEDMIKVTQ